MYGYHGLSFTDKKTETRVPSSAPYKEHSFLVIEPSRKSKVLNVLKLLAIFGLDASRGMPWLC